MKKVRFWAAAVLLAFSVLWGGCTPGSPAETEKKVVYEVPETSNPEVPYVEVENNQPDFSQEEKTEASFETYSELDSLGRCGTAFACIGRDLMPTQERESISQVKPSGWQNEEYDFVDGNYLYNRCHLIGFQLTGENANEKNLITGTRYMNVEGMLPFENMVADYVKETGNHVLYRVTPVFEGDNLVADGVEMEGLSVEDDGEGICFHVFVYNVQPGVAIDYKTGDSQLMEERETESPKAGEQEYILNTNSHKFHLPDCPSVQSIKEKNKEVFWGTRQELLNDGYEPCQNCRP